MSKASGGHANLSCADILGVLPELPMVSVSCGYPMQNVTVSVFGARMVVLKCFNNMQYLS